MWKLWTSRWSLCWEDEQRRFKTRKEARKYLKELVEGINAHCCHFVAVNDEETEFRYAEWDPNKPMRVGIEEIKSE